METTERETWVVATLDGEELARVTGSRDDAEKWAGGRYGRFKIVRPGEIAETPLIPDEPNDESAAPEETEIVTDTTLVPDAAESNGGEETDETETERAPEPSDDGDQGGDSNAEAARDRAAEIPPEQDERNAAVTTTDVAGWKQLWYDVKTKHPEKLIAVLFGDEYVFNDDDAVIALDVIGDANLTIDDDLGCVKVHETGLENALEKLTAAGHQVAVANPAENECQVFGETPQRKDAAGNKVYGQIHVRKLAANEADREVVHSVDCTINPDGDDYDAFKARLEAEWDEEAYFVDDGDIFGEPHEPRPKPKQLEIKEKVLKGGVGGDAIKESAVPKKPNRDQIQDRINRLVAKHGVSVQRWPDLDERLADIGLAPVDATDAVWAAAEKELIRSQTAELKGRQKSVKLAELPDGTEFVISGGKDHPDWEGVKIAASGKDALVKVDRDGKMEEAVWPGATLVAPKKRKEPTIVREVQPMKIELAEGRSLLVTMGLAKAGEWDGGKIGERLNRLSGLIEDGLLKEPKGGHARALYVKINKAVDAGRPVVVEGNGKHVAAEANGHEEPAAPKKRGRPKKIVADAAPKEPKAAKVVKEPKTPKVPKPKERKTRVDGQPSNKEVVYKLWLGEKEIDPEKCLKKVSGAVKLTTIRAWIGQWKNKNNLPACAKTK